MNFQQQIPISLTYRVREKLNHLTQKERSRFLSKIRRIINGQNSAKQIKQLNSSLKHTLFRIRYNLNQRIIASLVKSPHQQKYLKILDFVSHDEMDRGRFSTEDNDYEIIDINDIMLEETTNYDQLDNAFLWVEESININPEDWEIRDDDFWIYVVNPESQEDPDLLLSLEQNTIAQRELPLLLTGSAGSGKTTIAVYSALHKTYQNPQSQVLYITYSPALKKYAQGIVNKTCEKELKNLIFWDYTSLCKDFGKKYKLIDSSNFLGFNQITQRKFVEYFCPSRNLRGIEPISLWQEIRHLLKGSASATETENGLITEEDYLELNYQSSLPGDCDYEYVYMLASQYQNWLKNNGYWDEIDITYQLLKKIPPNFAGIYDFIYGDEVQDLTAIQIKFLLTILKTKPGDTPNFFLTGDPAQIINPSGFSWKKIKGIIYQMYQEVPQWQQIKENLEPQQLTTNFRSVASIVKLGEKILEITAKDNPNDMADYPHQHAVVVSTEKPLIISGDETEILANRDTFGSFNAIIVTNEEEKNKLVAIFSKDGIKTERILTIQEVKGLEFDQVLVWKFFTDFENWHSKKNSTIKELEKFKYNCLYVCTTRARKKLYFYDEQISSFWRSPEIESFVNQADYTVINQFFENYETREELLQSAEEYENIGAYRLAIENYLRAGEEKLAKRAEARWEEQAANWERAGDIWDNLNYWEEAYRCWLEVDEQLWQKKWEKLSQENYLVRARYFEEKQDYELAYYCYEKAQDLAGEIRCLENTNQWELAGDKYTKNRLRDKAQFAYLLAEEYYRHINELHLAALMWTKLKQWEKVATIWEELQDWQKAAQGWRHRGKKEKEALCYEKLSQWSKAENIWRQIGNWEKLAIACEHQEKWLEVEECWRKIGNRQKIAIACQHQKKWVEAATLWETEEIWEQAGCSWFQAKQAEKAAQCYEKAENWEQAEICWRKISNRKKAAIACEHQEKWEEAAKLYEKLKQWQKAASLWEKTALREKTAQCYEKAQNWQQAQIIWQELGNLEKVALAHEKQQQWLEAAQLWENLLLWQSAAPAWKKIGEKEKAALCYEKAQDWEQAQIIWQELGNRLKVALSCEKQAKWIEAAAIWLELENRYKAAEAYEKAKAWPIVAELWQELGQWNRLAIALEFQGKWLESALIWLEIKAIKNAAECYEKAHHWAKAEACWLQIHNLLRVASSSEYQGKWEKAAKIWENFQFWGRAAIAWLEIEEREKAALCFEKIGLWNEAEICWRQVNNWEKIAIACEQQENWSSAAIAWMQIKEIEKAQKCQEKISQYWQNIAAC